MRCKACDALLTDFESTIKCINSGEFLDLCSVCRGYIINVVDTTERYDLYDPDVDILEYDTIQEGNERPTPSSSDDTAEGDE